MESVRRVHLWEIIRYEPKVFFILDAVSKTIKQILESDVSYIQYYLEEMFGSTDIRSFSFEDCKRLL